ncbi:hypothetical protein HYX13_02955 [Candidatus Woesearchaeota archaeon]|nr:hypothetical protein [Candidatus Woesearchaeota archaeon]
MVTLTGELAEEAQQVLEDLHRGIDAGKKAVTATHDFETKLLAMDMLIMHLHFNYAEHEGLIEFFIQISECIVALRDELEALNLGEIHIIIQEEATEKKSPLWVFKHRKKVKKRIVQEQELEREMLQKVAAAWKKMYQKFQEAEELFVVDLKKIKVKEIYLELEEKHEEVKHILERLLGFFGAYQHFLQQQLKS